jgi:hypothetical protein
MNQQDADTPQSMDGNPLGEAAQGEVEHDNSKIEAAIAVALGGEPAPTSDATDDEIEDTPDDDLEDADDEADEFDDDDDDVVLGDAERQTLKRVGLDDDDIKTIAAMPTAQREKALATYKKSLDAISRKFNQGDQPEDEPKAETEPAKAESKEIDAIVKDGEKILADILDDEQAKDYAEKVIKPLADLAKNAGTQSQGMIHQLVGALEQQAIGNQLEDVFRYYGDEDKYGSGLTNFVGDSKKQARTALVEKAAKRVAQRGEGDVVSEVHKMLTSKRNKNTNERSSGGNGTSRSRGRVPKPSAQGARMTPKMQEATDESERFSRVDEIVRKVKAQS